MDSPLVQAVIMPILAWLTSQRGSKITRMSAEISITFSPPSGSYTSEVECTRFIFTCDGDLSRESGNV